MSSYLSALLDPRISYGFVGGPTFVTQRVELPSGKVRRSIIRDQPTYRYSLDYNAISVDGSVSTAAAYSTLVALFNRTRGSKAFRFKDWLDYTLTSELIGTGTGALTTFQMTKTYGALDGDQLVRTLTKPVTTATAFGYDDRTVVSVYINDVLDATAAVSATTGIITPTTTPPNGHTVKVSGHFDVAVVFDQDDFLASYNDFRSGAVQISLVEDRYA